jgi:cytochrome c-type biogenesis protein CcmH/NrfG
MSTDRFTRGEVQRIVDVTGKQLDYWEKLRLVEPRKSGDEKFYDFRDLISLRTAKQLIEKGVTATRLRRSLAALQSKLTEVQEPLTELRILYNGRDVVVDCDGARLEPISGQFMLNFDTRELRDKVRIMPERNAEAWFLLALQYESQASGAKAIDAYERALAVDPHHVEALINLGMLHYEQGNLEKAMKYFERAVERDSRSAIAQFNLGSILDEIGQLERARQHLRLAVRLDDSYGDAHYNLAFVCDKLEAPAEARKHWQRYIALEPAGPWSKYARQRLVYLRT